MATIGISGFCINTPLSENFYLIIAQIHGIILRKRNINLSKTNILRECLMQFENICPFVRYAVKTTYLPNRYMVKARDCRLFYTITGRGTFVTPGLCLSFKAGQSCAVSGRSRLHALARKRGQALILYPQF